MSRLAFGKFAAPELPHADGDKASMGPIYGDKGDASFGLQVLLLLEMNRIVCAHKVRSCRPIEGRAVALHDRTLAQKLARV